MRKFLLALVLVHLLGVVCRAQVTLNLANTHQTISGFGGATAFQCSSGFTNPCNTWTTAEADLLFCQTPFAGPTCAQNGAGLTYLRVQADPDGNYPFISNMLAAQARGAKIWIAPWTAPAAYKTNNSETNGGSLCDGTNGCGNVNHYQDWATYLSNYIKTLATTYGVTVFALSVQNEPDFTATYQSMNWTGAQFDNFIKNYLGPTLTTNNPGVKIIMPEESHWQNDLATTCEGDTNCAQYVSVVAAHGYNTTAPGPLTINAGQEMWQSEDATLNGSFDPSMSDALNWAGQIHNYLTAANITAWIWWFAVSNGFGSTDPQGLINGASGDNVSKRMWATGNWSNFVRPGWVRVDASVQPLSGVFVSAFKNGAAYAVIVVNTNASTQNLSFTGAQGTSITPYVTSASLNLVAQAPIAISSGAFSATLAASSVTTFSVPAGQFNITVGWHRIPATAPCGGGPESNAAYTDPDNFPNNLNASYASYGFGFTSNCPSMMNDSNSGAYDTTRHRLLLHGGGHEHYWGNDIISLEFTSTPPAWTGFTVAPYMIHLDHSPQPAVSVICPSGPISTTMTYPNGAICQYGTQGMTNGTVLQLPTCSYASGTLVDGTTGCVPNTPTPGSVHDYNGLLYIPKPFDKVLVCCGATAPAGNQGNNIWLLDASTIDSSCAPRPTGTYAQQQGCNPKWTPVGNPANNNLINSGVGAIAAWDAGQQLAWIMTQNGIHSLNPATLVLTSPSSPGLGYHSSGAIDPIDEIFFTVGPAGTAEGMEWFSIAPGSTFTRNTVTDPSCTTLTTAQSTQSGLPPSLTDALPAAQYQGTVWDSRARQFVIFPNGSNVIWTVDPHTWKCTQETYGTTYGVDVPWYTDRSVPTFGDEGTFGHFQFDPVLDIFIVSGNVYNQDSWYLKRAR